MGIFYNGWDVVEGEEEKFVHSHGALVLLLLVPCGLVHVIEIEEAGQT